MFESNVSINHQTVFGETWSYHLLISNTTMFYKCLSFPEVNKQFPSKAIFFMKIDPIASQSALSLTDHYFTNNWAFINLTNNLTLGLMFSDRKWPYRFVSRIVAYLSVVRIYFIILSLLEVNKQFDTRNSIIRWEMDLSPTYSEHNYDSRLGSRGCLDRKLVEKNCTALLSLLSVR